MSVLPHPRPFSLSPAGIAPRSDLLRQGILALGGSLLVAASAHVSVPLPFTPVPLTLQTLAVLLVGFMLGPRLAFGSLMLYLVEGASGFPVFSPAGPGGLLQMLGPTGGYLWSYPFAAAAAGFLFRYTGGDRLRFISGIVAGTAAVTLILASGGLWLGSILHLSASTTITHAITPFLPGEAVKICAAAGIAAALGRPRS